MLYPLAKTLIALSLAYATVPPNARVGFQQQLTLKNIASRTTMAVASSALCNMVHEAGHALTTRALGHPWPDYICIGAHDTICTPKHSFFNIGNIYLAGWDTRHMNISPLKQPITIGELMLIMLAGPLSGLLGYAYIKHLTKKRLTNKLCVALQIESLLPTPINQSPSDMSQIMRSIPMLAPYLQHHGLVMATLGVRFGLKAYAYWPSQQQASNTKPAHLMYEKQSYGERIKTMIHASSLAYCNRTLFRNLNTPMHFDIIKEYPAGTPTT